MLARSCCSLLLKQLQTCWICLILIDPPILTANDKSDTPVPCNFQSMQASNEYFQPTELFSTFRQSRNPNQDIKKSTLDKLSHYYQITSFTSKEPTLSSLTYYPVRLVMSEWLLYTHLTGRFLKHYEFNLQDVKSRLHDDDMRDLQRWRRRCKQSKHKLTILSKFIDFHCLPLSRQDGSSPWRTTSKEIEHVQSELEDFAKALENILPVATSMVQILDARYSSLHAANTTRLAYIALVFVPLSWVASLFSMSEGYGPGGEQFWQYFAIAGPLALLTVLVSETFRVGWGTVIWRRARG